MKTQCQCGKRFNWMNDGHVVDAWEKDDTHFFEVQCECGKVKELKFPSSFNYTVNSTK